MNKYMWDKKNKEENPLFIFVHSFISISPSLFGLDVPNRINHLKFYIPNHLTTTSCRWQSRAQTHRSLLGIYLDFLRFKRISLLYDWFFDLFHNGVVYFPLFYTFKVDIFFAFLLFFLVYFSSSHRRFLGLAFFYGPLLFKIKKNGC